MASFTYFGIFVGGMRGKCGGWEYGRDCSNAIPRISNRPISPSLKYPHAH